MSYVTHYPDVVPRLTDGTVVLRAMTEADLPASVEQSTDPETVLWTTVPSPYSLDDAREYLDVIRRGWEEGGDAVFALELANPADGGDPVPFAGLLDVRRRGTASWEVGFATHPAARGRGVMTAALRLAAAWAFEEGAPSLYWYAGVGNWASWRVAWRVGMTWHGTLPQRIAGRDGRSEDAWCASLLPDQPMEPRTPWVVAPVLEGEQVRLRPWRDDDGEGLEPRDDPAHWIPSTGPSMTSADFPAWLERRRSAVASGAVVDWCIADRESDRALGDLDVFVRNGTLDSSDVAEIGYQLTPSARGRGVATEAARLAVSYAVRRVDDGGLGIRRLVAETAADNEASNTVLRRAGFVVWGREHSVDRLPDGSYADALYWELVDES
ncbi:hypothetical protein GCM10022199_25200 [Marihabitans asiaticum]|uniref:RimJ/RimL family protein N-acetyltransferase n=1 Tax=Marihabitans asiaticum TaxID=415218 RepID=A0A560W9F2_9MICO|nr:RimJ/RimL family protein N-acetyltransferase [Marihabitans asiaticum]